MTEDSSAQPPTSKKITALIGASLLIVFILLGSVYWSSLGLLSQTSLGNNMFLKLIRKHQFYAAAIGCTTGLTAVLVMLYSLRVARPLSKILDEQSRLDDHGSEFKQVRQWLYYQLKWRIIGLVIFGSSLIIILFGSLHVSLIAIADRYQFLSPESFARLMGYLSYYGAIGIATVLLSLLIIVLLGLRYLKNKLSHMEPDQLQYVEEFSLFEFPSLLLNLNSDELPKKLRQKQLRSHLEQQHDELNEDSTGEVNGDEK